MIQLLVFGLFITFGVACLAIWPIMRHPSLPRTKKWQLSLLVFFMLVPLGIALYAWLGVPPMAGVSA